MKIFQTQRPPEATIKYNQTKKDFDIIGIDDREGDVNVRCRDLISRILSSKKQKICTLKDKSGNTLGININYRKDKENILLAVSSLIYNGNKTKPFKNTFSITDNKKMINQTIYINSINLIKVNADYNKTTNKTGIIIVDNGNSTRYIKEGLVLIELKTDKGNLKYNIDNISRIPDVQVYPIYSRINL